MLNITDALIGGQNRPGRKLVDLRGIAIHYTANSNPGATAMANRNYFNNTTTYASAHYIVDENTIVRCIPDDEVAYHVGAYSYTDAAMQMTGGDNPNNYMIGIEICNNGNWDAAVENSAQLTAYLCSIHNLNPNNLWRHYDVTWKNCPAPMVGNPESWVAFKNRVAQILNGTAEPIPTPAPAPTLVGFTYPNNAQVVGDDLYIRDANGNQIPGRYVSNGDRITVLNISYSAQLALVEYPTSSGVRSGYVTNATSLIKYFYTGQWANGSTPEPVLDQNGNAIGSLDPREQATPLYRRNGLLHVVYDTAKGHNTKSGFVVWNGGFNQF